MSYKDNYKLIDWSKTPELPERQFREPARADLPCPMVIQDTMAPVQSMLDGKMYDSKSQLRSTYRAAGVNEIGNDPARFKKAKPKPKLDRQVLKDTLEQARARVSRGETAS